MAAFRRVIGDRAGPDALGVLVPPTRRTLVIVRPRSLADDLVLLADEAAAVLREVDPDEGADLAHELCRALEAWNQGGPGRIDLVAGDDGRHWVRVVVGPHALVVCPRRPGEPYQPLTVADPGQAEELLAGLRAVLCPGPDAGRELYVNIRHFSR